MLKRSGFIGIFLIFFLSFATGQKLVYLEHSETLSFEEERIPDAQILRGNVRFRHEDMLMFCDSAYFFEKSNSLTAFSNVRFEQGDTLHGYGDVLYYDGNTRLARLRRDVRLIHRETVLTTDSMNYDRAADKAYYFTGGVIKDSLNSLESVWGEYCPKTYTALFSRQVHLTNPSFVIDTDTLKYNTQTHVADLPSASEIVYEDSTLIHSHKGRYNTETDDCMLLDRSVIVHNDSVSLTGDTIFYNKEAGYGRMSKHIEVCDSSMSVTLYGNYGEVWEKRRHGYVTDSALVEEWSGEEHTWLHADTLLFDEADCPDSTCTKQTYKLLRAYGHVRTWSEEYQSASDSMVYTTRDSTLTMYGSPVCWNGDNQASADLITVYFKNGKMDYVHGKGSILGTQPVMAERYNQITGAEMTAHVTDGDIKVVDVTGSTETAFFPKEQDGSLTGINKTQSEKVQIFLKDRQIDHILFTTATSGTLYPLEQIEKAATYLSGFFRSDDERPQSVEDLFRHPERSKQAAAGGGTQTEKEDKSPAETETQTIKTKKLK